MRDSGLKLADLNREMAVLLQQLHLPGILVGDTEGLNLTRFVENLESLCNLRRVSQGIRAVQKKQFHMVGVQPLQAFIHRLQDMLLREIIGRAALNDATLGLQDHLITH